MNKTLAISVILSIVGLTQVYSQYIPFIGKDKYWIYINHDNGEPAPRVIYPEGIPVVCRHVFHPIILIKLALIMPDPIILLGRILLSVKYIV